MALRRERALSAVEQSGLAQGKIMITEKCTIAELDIELSSVGGYDVNSGMPSGCIYGPIRPFIRPESAGDVTSLVPVIEE